MNDGRVTIKFNIYSSSKYNNYYNVAKFRESSVEYDTFYFRNNVLLYINRNKFKIISLSFGK